MIVKLSKKSNVSEIVISATILLKGMPHTQTYVKLHRKPTIVTCANLLYILSEFSTTLLFKDSTWWSIFLLFRSFAAASSVASSEIKGKTENLSYLTPYQQK